MLCCELCRQRLCLAIFHFSAIPILAIIPEPKDCNRISSSQLLTVVAVLRFFDAINPLGVSPLAAAIAYCATTAILPHPIVHHLDFAVCVTMILFLDLWRGDSSFPFFFSVLQQLINGQRINQHFCWSLIFLTQSSLQSADPQSFIVTSWSNIPQSDHIIDCIGKTLRVPITTVSQLRSIS